jgi:hypothetical protein
LHFSQLFLLRSNNWIEFPLDNFHLYKTLHLFNRVRCQRNLDIYTYYITFALPSHWSFIRALSFVFLELGWDCYWRGDRIWTESSFIYLRAFAGRVSNTCCRANIMRGSSTFWSWGLTQGRTQIAQMILNRIGNSMQTCNRPSLSMLFSWFIQEIVGSSSHVYCFFTRTTNSSALV